MIRPKNAEELAVWLANNQPEVFEGALRAALGEKIPTTVSNLAGISDVLSSIGTSLGSAVKTVGTFLASEEGIKTLGTVGGLYLQSQSQKDALKLQVATVQAGNSPYAIQNTGYNTNSAVPIYTATGQVLTSSLANQLTPQNSLASYAPWAIAAVVGIGLVFALKSR